MATKKSTAKQASKQSPNVKAKAPRAKAAKPEVSTTAPATEAATKPKRKQPAAESKGPGVIGTVIELLNGASEQSPISKAMMLDKLVERFPDREPDAMRKTINCQVPTRLAKEKGLAIKKNKDGYWVA